MRPAAIVLLALALGCGPAPRTSSTATEVAETGGDEARPPSEAPTRGWHHFWVIRQARDAVMRGDVASARAILARIAVGDLGEDFPVDWLVWIEEMQDEAARAKETRQRRRVAEIVSSIASICGDCHRSKKGPPQNLPLTTLEQMAHIRSDVVPAAADHRWAADELWIGMTIPVHQAWVRGSRALIDSPLHAVPPPAPPPPPPTEQSAVTETSPPAVDEATPAETPPPIDPKLSRGLQALAEVGERLYSEGRPLPMARAYAALISRCASCHQDS